MQIQNNLQAMKRIFGIAAVIVCLGISCTQENQEIAEGWEFMEEILERITEPEFPEIDFLITDYGATEGGEHICTEAFAKAIAACNAAGGGRVVVPPGKFLSGAIHLLDNVELHLETGATIAFSTRDEDYLPVVLTRYEGMELYNYSALIYAYGKQNIAVTGKGLLDGQASGENWWNKTGDKKHNWQEGMPSAKNPDSRDRLFELMQAAVPTEERIFGKGYGLRPNFIQFYKCKNILIEGVTLIRPPMWMLHPVLSENIIIRDVTLVSKDAPNGDGCDPEACKDILIEDCFFDTGDDCIAIKSGRNRQGYDLGIPTENVIIRNCKMVDGHGGVVIGSELSGGVRNVFAYDCEMSSPNLDRALRLKSNSHRGGVIENIYMRNIKVGEVKGATIRINQNYSSWAEGDGGNYTLFRNIYVENMTCNKARYAIQLLGNENLPIENIQVINCTFENVKDNMVVESVNGLQLVNVSINGEKISN